MILPVSSFSDLADSAAAGAALVVDIERKLGWQKPAALIVFASSKRDYQALLAVLASAFPGSRLAWLFVCGRVPRANVRHGPGFGFRCRD